MHFFSVGKSYYQCKGNWCFFSWRFIFYFLFKKKEERKRLHWHWSEEYGKVISGLTGRRKKKKNQLPIKEEGALHLCVSNRYWHLVVRHPRFSVFGWESEETRKCPALIWLEMPKMSGSSGQSFQIAGSAREREREPNMTPPNNPMKRRSTTRGKKKWRINKQTKKKTFFSLRALYIIVVRRPAHVVVVFVWKEWIVFGREPKTRYRQEEEEEDDEKILSLYL